MNALNVGSVYAALKLDTSQFDKALRNSTSSAESGARKAEASFSSLKGTLSQIAPILGGITAAGAVGGMLKLAANAEQANMAFTRLLGSASAAKQYLSELQQFAARTPFEFTDLVTASRRMMAFGIEAEKVLPTLSALGDAVSAMGGGSETIDRVTLALGQMSAKGKVSAEEMLQLTEAGIPAWDILAKAIGKTTAETQKLVTKGAIPAKSAIDALVSGMNARFGGMMAEQAKTAAGQFSNLKDQTVKLATELGTVLLPAANDVVGILSRVTGWVDSLSSEQKRGIVTIGEYTAGVLALNKALRLVAATNITGSVVSSVAAVQGSVRTAIQSRLTAQANSLVIGMEAARAAGDMALFNKLLGQAEQLGKEGTRSLGFFSSLFAWLSRLNPTIVAVTVALTAAAGAWYLLSRRVDDATKSIKTQQQAVKENISRLENEKTTRTALANEITRLSTEYDNESKSISKGNSHKEYLATLQERINAKLTEAGKILGESPKRWEGNTKALDAYVAKLKELDGIDNKIKKRQALQETLSAQQEMEAAKKTLTQAEGNVRAAKRTTVMGSGVGALPPMWIQPPASEVNKAVNEDQTVAEARKRYDDAVLNYRRAKARQSLIEMDINPDETPVVGDPTKADRERLAALEDRLKIALNRKDAGKGSQSQVDAARKSLVSFLGGVSSRWSGNEFGRQALVRLSELDKDAYERAAAAAQSRREHNERLAAMRLEVRDLEAEGREALQLKNAGADEAAAYQRYLGLPNTASEPDRLRLRKSWLEAKGKRLAIAESILQREESIRQDSIRRAWEQYQQGITSPAQMSAILAQQLAQVNGKSAESPRMSEILNDSRNFITQMQRDLRAYEDRMAEDVAAHGNRLTGLDIERQRATGTRTTEQDLRYVNERFASVTAQIVAESNRIGGDTAAIRRNPKIRQLEEQRAELLIESARLEKRFREEQLASGDALLGLGQGVLNTGGLLKGVAVSVFDDVASVGSYIAQALKDGFDQTIAAAWMHWDRGLRQVGNMMWDLQWSPQPLAAASSSIMQGIQHRSWDKAWRGMTAPGSSVRAGLLQLGDRFAARLSRTGGAVGSISRWIGRNQRYIGAAVQAYGTYQDIRNSDSPEEGALSGAIGGAGIGMEVAGPWGALAGAIIGGIGGALFGGDEARRRAEAEANRIREAQLAELKKLNNQLTPMTDFFRSSNYNLLPGNTTYGGNIAQSYAVISARGARI